MFATNWRRACHWAKASLGYVLVAGVAGVVSAWTVMTWHGAGPLPETPLHAFATHSTEGLTLASGTLEQNLEAVIAVDHVSGEMTGYVANPNNPAGILVQYVYPNVNNDLGVKTKSPKYTVVTAMSPFKPAGAARLGMCVVYIAEESTGTMVAYGMPWDPGRKSGIGGTAKLNFVKLFTARTGTGVRRS
jgi:hypothetical protein